MNRKSTVLIIHSGTNADVMPKCFARLDHFGWQQRWIYTDTQAKNTPQTAVPDVIVLLIGENGDVQRLKEHAAQLRSTPTTAGIPIAASSNSTRKQDRDGAFDIAADLHFDAQTPAHVLGRKLKQVVRRSSMEREYNRRLATLESFGPVLIDNDNEQTETPPHVAVIGKGERFFQISRLFAGKVRLTALQQIAEVEHIHERNPINCLIVDTKETPALSFQTFKSMRMDARFFHIPVIILPDGLTAEDQIQIRNDDLGDIFELDEDANEIVVHTNTLLKSEAARQRLTKALNSPTFEKVRDASTALFNREFTERYLKELTDTIRVQKTALSIGIVQADLSSVFAQDKAVRASILRQMGQTIQRLARADDLTAYLGDGRFAIAAANTPSLAMSVLMGRIGAIIRMTEFSCGGEPGRVDVDSRYFEVFPEDAFATVWKRITS